MSKGFNKILDFMKLNDDEYEEYDDEEIDTEEEPEEAPKKKTFARSTANSRKTSARQKDELEDMADDWDDEPEVKSTRSTQAHTSSRSTRKATSYGRSSKIVPMHSNITSRSMEVCFQNRMSLIHARKSVTLSCQEELRSSILML